MYSKYPSPQKNLHAEMRRCFKLMIVKSGSLNPLVNRESLKKFQLRVPHQSYTRVVSRCPSKTNTMDDHVSKNVFRYRDEGFFSNDQAWSIFSESVFKCQFQRTLSLSILLATTISRPPVKIVTPTANQEVDLRSAESSFSVINQR